MHPTLFNPFPTSSLGPILGAAVGQHQSNSQLSAELIAPLALGLVAAAVQDLFDVKRPNLTPSPISLFVLIRASTGDGKDAGAAPFVRPFFQFQAQADEEHKKLLVVYNVELQSWKVRQRVLLAQMEQRVRNDEPLADLKEQLSKLLEQRPRLPGAPLVIYDDATLSAIKVSLCERWHSGMFYSMEGSELLNGPLGAEYPFFNAAWGGQPIFSDRVVEGRRAVRDPRLGIVLSIQPEPLNRFMKRRGLEAHDSGGTARFLFASPPSTKGYRFIGAAQVSTCAIDECAHRIREFLHLGAERTKAGEERCVLRFTPEAATKFVEIYNRLQTLVAPGQLYSNISGQAAKAAENVARVAAVLHVFEGQNGDITEQTLARAAVIVEWFVNQFLMLFGSANSVPSVEEDAASIEQSLWRAFNLGHNCVPRAHVEYWAPSDIEGTRLKRALRHLVANGKVVVGTWKRREYVILSQVWTTHAIFNNQLTITSGKSA